MLLKYANCCRIMCILIESDTCHFRYQLRIIDLNYVVNSRYRYYLKDLSTKNKIVFCSIIFYTYHIIRKQSFGTLLYIHIERKWYSEVPQTEISRSQSSHKTELLSEATWKSFSSTNLAIHIICFFRYHHKESAHPPESFDFKPPWTAIRHRGKITSAHASTVNPWP